MNNELVLYWLLFIVRIVIFTIIWHKYGWKACGLAFMYTLLTVISEALEVG